MLDKFGNATFITKNYSKAHEELMLRIEFALNCSKFMQITADGKHLSACTDNYSVLL